MAVYRLVEQAVVEGEEAGQVAQVVEGEGHGRMVIVV